MFSFMKYFFFQTLYWVKNNFFVFITIPLFDFEDLDMNFLCHLFGF
jgi:hypothetical protein